MKKGYNFWKFEGRISWQHVGETCGASQVAKGLLKVLAGDSSHFYVALIMKLYMK